MWENSGSYMPMFRGGRPLMILNFRVIEFLKEIYNYEQVIFILRIHNILILSFAASLFFIFVQKYIKLKKIDTICLTFLIFFLPGMQLPLGQISTSVNLISLIYVLISLFFCQEAFLAAKKNKRIFFITISIFLIFISLLTYQLHTFFFLLIPTMYLVTDTEKKFKIKISFFFIVIFIFGFLLYIFTYYFIIIPYAENNFIWPISAREVGYELSVNLIIENLKKFSGIWITRTSNLWLISDKPYLLYIIFFLSLFSLFVLYKQNVYTNGTMGNIYSMIGI